MANDLDILSCQDHPEGVAEGCEPCRIIANDILTCPDHPDGTTGECQACNAILEVWANFAVNSSQRAAKSGARPMAWYSGHGARS